MDIPVFKIENYKFQITVDITLYSKEAITATLYKYSGQYYVYESINADNGNLINIILESKDGNLVSETTPKQFYNDLIDQQLRVDVNKQSGHIRDLIVEEAFKPVRR